MSFSIASRTASRLAAFGCLLVICCVASTAKASCGDYLAHPGEAGVKISKDLYGTAGPTAPCRGPQCRQAPDHPPLPAPHRVVILPTRDALGLLASNDVLDIQSAWLVVESDDELPSSPGRRFFRPPRV